MAALKIGVVSLPAVVPLLRAEGYEVITGEDFRTGAGQVRLALQTGKPFPVLVGDGPGGHVAAAAWLRSVAAHAPVALVELDGGNGLRAEQVNATYRAPVGLGEVLMDAGAPFPPDALFAATITSDGSVDQPRSPAPGAGAGDDPWATTSVLPPAKELVHEPTPPAGAAASGDDPWETTSTIPGVATHDRPPPAHAPGPEAATDGRQQTAAPAAAPEPDPDEEDFVFDQQPATAPAAQRAALPPELPGPPVRPATATRNDERLEDLADLLAEPDVHVGDWRADASRLGEVIILTSGKGGTSKSTAALNLAQYAARRGPAGLRVTVVDANRGQGDLRTYLRIPTAPIPTVYDTVPPGDPARALITPATLARYRDARWGALGFALVAAPPADLADPQVVTAQVYREAIAHARAVSDIVVVDTQIREAYDTSLLWDRVLLPLLTRGAWCLAVSDNSTPGVRNLVERLAGFQRAGVPRDRVLLTLAKVPQRDLPAAELLAQRMAAVGRYVGTVPLDARIETEMKVGRLPFDNEHLAPVLATTLHTVTGIAEFDPALLLPAGEPGRLARLLARWKARP